MTISRRNLLELAALTAVSPAARSADRPDFRTDTAPSWTRTGPPTNVVLIVLDDVGFADLGCYGSEVATPALDSLAASGVRFSNFHVTALCSPTRACLLTGRDHHAVGVGTIPEWAMPREAYRGFISPAVATLPELLRAGGYSCYAVGKWHLTLVADANAAGPFDHWPTSRGFDRWYGFHGPVADHWHPELFENTSFVPGPHAPPYHLSEDLVDRSIAFVRDHVTAAPDRPFFLYLAFGACHWPLQVPPAFVAGYRGRYDAGWEAVREARLARQLETGVVPSGTRLAPPNDNVPEWSSLDVSERRVAARLQEVYAGFLQHTDGQIGRLLAFLADTSLRDQTLIVALSDNGASSEGGRLGAVDVRRTHYASPETTADLVEALDSFGDDSTFAAYARGWAQASNTPLRWYKATAFGGGVRAPLIVSHPTFVPAADRGAIRTQFGHVSDLMPTVLELVGAPTAEGTNKTARNHGPAMKGRSLAACVHAGAARTPRREQFFETNGHRGIWIDGWKAVARHEPGRDFERDPWSLYDLDEDFNELHDLSATFPERLAEMRRRWTSVARAMGVLPMDDRNAERLALNTVPGRAKYVFLPGMARLDRLSAPDIYDRSFLMRARFTVDWEAASGVVLAAGTSLAGYEWLLLAGRPVFAYVLSRTERFVIHAGEALSAGEHTLEVDFVRTGPGSGIATLRADGAAVGAETIPRQWRLYAVHAGVRCGANTGAPVTRLYAGALPFEGRLEWVTVELR